MIYTLNARDTVILDLISFQSNLDMYSKRAVISYSIEKCIEDLRRIGVDYHQIKNALIPSKKKKEIVLIFDIIKTGGGFYGDRVIKKVIGALEKSTTCSLLVGDLLEKEGLVEKLKGACYENILGREKVSFENPRKYFLVYINNLSSAAITKLYNDLADYDAFSGYFDVTYNSWLKTYISTVLVPYFVKSKKTLISRSEYTGEINPLGLSIAELGYNSIGLEDVQFNLFLNYKIEWHVEADLNDLTFSLNAISDNVIDIRTLDVSIDSTKLNYLKAKKTDNMERFGFYDLEVDVLKNIIQDRINKNYIYNLDFLEQHGTMKFNVMLELLRADNLKPIKVLVGLEYLPVTKQLRLLTMF